MSHPNPAHDPENVYPSDHYAQGQKRTLHMQALSKMLTTSHSESKKAGKGNAKYSNAMMKALKNKMK